MRWTAAIAIAVGVGCGGGRSTTRGAGDTGGDDPPPEPAASTPCGAMLAHLDATLGPGFAAGRDSIALEDGAVTRGVLVMRCASMSAWAIACLTLSSGPELAGCGEGNESTLRSTAGPSPEEKQKFEDCVVAARTRAALDQCSYYPAEP